MEPVQDTGVGTRASVADRVLGDLGKACKEHVLGHEALLAGIAVRTVILDAVRDVERVVHVAQRLDEESDLLIVVRAAEMHIVGDDAVALLRRLILGVVGDDLRQIHGIRRAVDDVRAVVCKGCARLVRHGVHDAEQRVGERLACKALCVVHLVARFHIAVVGRDEVLLDHLDRVDRKRIGEVAVRRRNISFDRVRHRVHTGMRDELLGHRLGKVGIDDGDVGRDLKVRNGILDALLIVGDDGKRRDFRRGTRSRRDGAELCLLAKLGNAEDLAHILERDVGIFVLDPHCLRSVDGRTAAHGDDPVGLELLHRSGAAHDGLDGRIGFDAFEELDFHARLFEVGNGTVEEAEALHRAAAHAHHCLLALKRLEGLERTLSVIKVSR